MDVTTVSQVQEHIDQYYPDDVIRAEDAALIVALIEEVRRGEG